MLTGEAWESVASKGFDDSRLFAAYLNTLKWNCVTSTDPKLFQSPFRAGIRHKAIDSLESELKATHIEDSRRAASEDELEASRERQHVLREQIERLRTLLENSRKSIGLSDTHFQAAISTRCS